jgi:hypothetical protein
MRHDKIECPGPVKVEIAEPEIPAFRTAASTNGLIHIRHDNGKKGCGCLAGFGQLLIWATRNNDH